jgi:hypothetical protein
MLVRVCWQGGCKVCVAGGVVCVGILLPSIFSAVVQSGGFEAGTVLPLFLLWGGRRRSHAVVEQAER